MARSRRAQRSPRPMDLRHLEDDGVRGLMLNELDLDVESDSVYFSKRLTDTGLAQWPELLRSALASGTPETLEADVGFNGVLKAHEPMGGGRPGSRRVPVTAAETLAQGEFNRYYMRALCVRVLDSDAEGVQWCRARHSGQVRPESAALDGQPADPAALLDELRHDVNVSSGPGSGMTRCVIPRRAG